MAKDRYPETWHGGETMKRLSVAFDDQFYASLKELAARHKTTMADLVRYAVDKTFEDQLDVIGVELSRREDALNPQGTTTWEDFKKELDSAVQDTPEEFSREGSTKNPGKVAAAHKAGNRRAGKRAIS